MNVDHAMSVVKPSSRPARSEMKNHSRSFSHSKNGESTGNGEAPDVLR